MAQSGIHAFSSIVVSKFLKNKKWFIPSFIFGSILPDIDILFAAILFLSGTNIFDAEAILRTFTHSLFTIIIIYFIFLSISEITSKQKFKIIGRGLCLGMILHCTLDIFLWFSPISLLWPMQPYLINPINIWGDIFLENEQATKKTILALEFIMFRFYGWFLINKAVNSNYVQNCIWFIIYISRWIKIEFGIFLFFSLLIYLNVNINSYKIFFTIMYIPSLIMALISTYILRDVLND